MKRNRKKFFSLLLLSALLLQILLLSGCGKNEGQSKAADGEKLVLNEVAHSIFYAPMYVALEEGYFEKEGLAVELVTGFGADKTMTALLSGEADIGLLGPEATVYMYAGDSDDSVVNIAQLTQRAGNFLVARNEMPDFTWQDLAEKNVLGGRKGGMPEMVFEYILKKNNLNPETDINIDQSIDFGSTSAAFSSGKGDFTVEFEPSATALETMGKGYHVVASLGVDSGYVPYTAFAVKKSYTSENSDNLQKFVNALAKGMNYVDTHTSEEIAKAIRPQFPETDMADLVTIVSRYHEQSSWNSSLSFEKDSFKLLLDILDSANELPDTEIPYEQLVDNTFANKASAACK